MTPDLAEALSIAREIARVATCMDAPKRGSIGELVAKLDALEERIARAGEFDTVTGAA